MVNSGAIFLRKIATQFSQIVTDGVYCGAVDENRYGWEMYPLIQL